MANPIFEKSGATTVTLTNAFDFGSSSSIEPRQTVQRTYDRGFSVVSRSAADVIFNLRGTQMLQTDIDDLVTFFESTVVNYAEHAFLYTDHLSVQRQVRYLESNLPGVPVGPGVVDVSLTLIVDAGPLD